MEHIVFALAPFILQTERANHNLTLPTTFELFMLICTLAQKALF